MTAKEPGVGGQKPHMYSRYPLSNERTNPLDYCGGEVREVLADVEAAGGKVTLVELEYTDPNGQSLALNQLLPPGVSIVKNDEYIQEDLSASFGSNLVAYGESRRLVFSAFGRSRPFWKDAGAMLVILHEFGHAIHDQNIPQEERVAWEWLRADEPYQLPERPDVGLVLNRLRRERRAWAYALTTLQQFRKQGIDLEPELPTLAEIAPHIHLPLSTYEKEIASKVPKYWVQIPVNEREAWLAMRSSHEVQARGGDASHLMRYALRPDHAFPPRYVYPVQKPPSAEDA